TEGSAKFSAASSPTGLVYVGTTSADIAGLVGVAEEAAGASTPAKVKDVIARERTPRTPRCIRLKTVMWAPDGRSFAGLASFRRHRTADLLAAAASLRAHDSRALPPERELSWLHT